MAIAISRPGRPVVRNLLRTRFIGGQVLLWLVVYAVYLGAQALVADQAARAQANAAHLRGVEAALGVDVEHALHDALRPVDSALASWYLAGYVPVLVAGLLWLGLSDRRAYRRARRALLAAFAIGLAASMLFPVAPPRLVPGLGLGAEAGLSAGSDDLFGLPYNEYAAFPSLHVGALILLAGVAVTVTASRAVRMLWLAQAFVMAVAVVSSGNHYIVDVLGGAAIGAALLPRRSARCGCGPHRNVIAHGRSHIRPDRGVLARLRGQATVMGDIDELSDEAKEAEGKHTGADTRETLEQGRDEAEDALDHAKEQAGDAKERLTGS